jgi:maltooligosyltrehalose synthase
LNVTYIDDLAANWRAGRIKQFVIARVLAMRKKMPRLFAEGTYYSISQYSALSVK